MQSFRGFSASLIQIFPQGLVGLGAPILSWHFHPAWQALVLRNEHYWLVVGRVDLHSVRGCHVQRHHQTADYARGVQGPAAVVLDWPQVFGEKSGFGVPGQPNAIIWMAGENCCQRNPPSEISRTMHPASGSSNVHDHPRPTHQLDGKVKKFCHTLQCTLLYSWIATGRLSVLVRHQHF